MILLPRESFNGVVNGQDVDSFAVFNIRTGLNRDNIRKADTQIVANDTIHANFFVGASFVGKNNANGLLATFSLQQHCVSSEQLQFVHFGLRKTHNRIIIVCGIVDDKTVWAILALQNCSRQVLVTV